MGNHHTDSRGERRKAKLAGAQADEKCMTACIAMKCATGGRSYVDRVAGRGEVGICRWKEKKRKKRKMLGKRTRYDGRCMTRLQSQRIIAGFFGDKRF